MSLCEHCSRAPDCEAWPLETSRCVEFVPAPGARDAAALEIAAGMGGTEGGERMKRWGLLVRTLCRESKIER